MRVLALLLVASPALADPVEGVWRTHAGADGRSGLVRIAPCGAGFCGSVVEGPHLGEVVLRDIPAGYGGGEVIDPSTGKSYAARLRLEGDRLEVAGCLMRICRTAGVWQRQD